MCTYIVGLHYTWAHYPRFFDYFRFYFFVSTNTFAIYSIVFSIHHLWFRNSFCPFLISHQGVGTPVGCLLFHSFIFSSIEQHNHIKLYLVALLHSPSFTRVYLSVYLRRAVFTHIGWSGVLCSGSAGSLFHSYRNAVFRVRSLKFITLLPQTPSFRLIRSLWIHFMESVHFVILMT